MSRRPNSKPWYDILYVQVLIAVAIGIAYGYFTPESGVELKPFGDAFIKLVRVVIAPIIFCTVVHGIASMGDVKKLGRLGIKTLFYFEVVSTFALILGLVVVNLWKPGAGMHSNALTLDQHDVSTYIVKAKPEDLVSFLLNIIPNTFVDAFAGGDIIQVLFLSILTGFAIMGLGEKGVPALKALAQVEKIFFGIMQIIVRFAPIAALGAMGYTVGKYGIGSLRQLAALMAGFYATSVLFVVLVLGTIARVAGFSIFRFLNYIKEEIFVVLSASASEAALPSLIEKIRRLGCSKSTVGFVIPTGYSFNLDGTNIYMTMAAIFLAQATDTPLTLHQEAVLLLVAMLSSKGASGVTGAGFIALAATLTAVPTIPVQSLALLVGIDRFMSECRAITNIIGNGVGAVVISRWEGELSAATLNEQLGKPFSVADLAPDAPEAV